MFDPEDNKKRNPAEILKEFLDKENIVVVPNPPQVVRCEDGSIIIRLNGVNVSSKRR